MSRRHLIARSIAIAALASIGMSMYTVPAHAVEFPKLPSATAESVCKDEGFQVLAGWKTHVANDPQSSGPVHFSIAIDAYPPYTYDLQPGDVKDDVFGVFDGVPSHIVITANGAILVDKTATRHCRLPLATITFSCAQPDATPTLTYTLSNKAPVPVTFTVHAADGSTDGHDLAKVNPYNPTYIGTETVSEGAHFDVSVTAAGEKLAAKTGVADCKAAPTTTTTVAHTVIAAQPDPVAPTTVAAAATLPRTGSSSTPLVALGFVLLCAGGGMLLVLRRRPATV